MSDCSRIDSLVTPYVDGELTAAEHHAVSEHVLACQSCRARVSTEQLVRDLIRARRTALSSEHASDTLRAKCAAIARIASETSASASAGQRQTPRPFLEGRFPARRVPAWRARLTPLALAATLVLIVGGAFVYQLTGSSTRVMAAELAADHVKCFAINSVLGTHQSVRAVESSLAATFGWPVRLPDTEAAGLELVGSRPCLYGEGRVAHIMYKHDGNPVSLFMLPGTRRSEQLVEVFGHEAAIWCIGDRTFVLIARGTTSEVQRMAAFIRASLQ